MVDILKSGTAYALSFFFYSTNSNITEIRDDKFTSISHKRYFHIAVALEIELASSVSSSTSIE